MPKDGKKRNRRRSSVDGPIKTGAGRINTGGVRTPSGISTASGKINTGGSSISTPLSKKISTPLSKKIKTRLAKHKNFR